jgi:hypothetical protein
VIEKDCLEKRFVNLDAAVVVNEPYPSEQSHSFHGTDCVLK